MLSQMDTIDIRVGTQEDGPGVSEFAISLAEDGEVSKEKWLKVIKQTNVYPLLADLDGKIIGKVQGRIVGDIGYLEAARVSPNFRQRGIATSLINSAMDWLITQNVKSIRALADSDNLPARSFLEGNNFNGKFLAINPSARITKADTSPELTGQFIPILDNEFYQEFIPKVNKLFAGNIMIDGRFVPFSQELFDQLIEEKRLITDNNHDTLIVKSNHNLPGEFHGCIISNSLEGYKNGGLAVRGYAAQEMASLGICFGPSKRKTVEGFVMAGFGWSQPHSLIIYQRDAWQGKPTNS